jgi:hypothetical protein
MSPKVMRRPSRSRHRRRRDQYLRGIAEWLVERLAEDAPTLVGIDHGFSFPLRYFEAHGLKPNWPAFLDDFQLHWPTDDDPPMSISCARECSAKAPRARAMPAGGG